MNRWLQHFILILATIAVITVVAQHYCAAEENSAVATYVVIVNDANGTNASPEQVKRLFLKLSGSWSGGIVAKPFDRKSDNSARSAFLTRVLQMDESQLANHWISMKQKTGVTRPLVVRSDRSVAKLVVRYTGAFGFLQLDNARSLPKGVRVLFQY